MWVRTEDTRSQHPYSGREAGRREEREGGAEEREGGAEGKLAERSFSWELQ